MTRSGRFARVRETFREAAAVLAAILVAFALDAWWDARVQRTEMLEALGAVAAEIDANVAALDSAYSLNAGMIEASLRGERLTPESVSRMTEEDIDGLTAAFDYELVTLERGAVTAFIEGGYLSAMDDDELRSLVAGLSIYQDELDEERAGVAVAEERLMDVAFEVITSHGSSPNDEGAAASSRGLALAIAGSDPLRRAMGQRAFAVSIYQEEVVRIRDRLAGVRDQIRQRLPQ